MTGSRMIATAAAASCLLVSACNGEGADGTTTSSSSSSTASSTTTTDYTDEAVEAARAWIEDDAGRITKANGTEKAQAVQKEQDDAFKRAGVKVQGHDSVVSAEVDKGLTNTTEVVIAVCVTTDKKMMLKGKNVRTDREGKPVKPGDRQLSTVKMHRDVGAEDWLVADSEVRKRSC